MTYTNPDMNEARYHFELDRLYEAVGPNATGESVFDKVVNEIADVRAALKNCQEFIKEIPLDVLVVAHENRRLRRHAALIREQGRHIL